MIKDIHQIHKCPDCGSSNIFHNDRKQQVICKDCGLIFEPLAPEDEKKFEKSHGIK